MSILDKIKLLFAETSVFADVKTKEGVLLRIEGDIAEGSKVSIINEDGTLTSTGAGDYILEDETVISTDGSGAIVKVVAVETEAEVEKPEEKPKEEMAPVEEAPEEIKIEGDKLVELESKVAELEAAITIIAEQLKSGMPAEAEMTEIKKENKSLKKQVKELAAEPATPGINFKKVESKDEKVKPAKENAMLSRLAKLQEEKNK